MLFAFASGSMANMENLIWGLVTIAVAAITIVPITIHIVLQHIAATQTVGGQAVKLIEQQATLAHDRAVEEADAQRELANSFRSQGIGE